MLRTQGMRTRHSVMLAMMTGTIVPKNATNFLNPELWTNPLLQVINTNVFTAIWSTPATTSRPRKISVKFAIRKNKNPVAPEMAIHFELLFFMFLPLSLSSLTRALFPIGIIPQNMAKSQAFGATFYGQLYRHDRPRPQPLEYWQK